jgi:uncharacterized protein
MHINSYIVLGSAIVGLLVGMTGAGGGALMTPMLILLFNVTPSSAISSDLVASVIMRPVGAAVHFRAGTVNKRLVGLLALGSVPSAIFGSYLLSLMGDSADDVTHIETVLGTALLIGAAAMVLRYFLDRRSGETRTQSIDELVVKPLPTVLVGVIGGILVGLTSVGSGSLMIILMMFLYPKISAKQLVGTDLAQAVPLTCAAALGALLFNSVEFGLTVSLIIGSVPAVLIGSLFSSRVPDKYIRPVIAFVILASGLKYVGLSTSALGWVMVIVLLGGAVFLLLDSKRASETPAAEAPASEAAATQST